MALGKSSAAFLGITRGIKEKAFSAGPCSGQGALCLGQASCAGLGSRAGPAGHRHSVLGISQAREQGSCSFTDLHLLSLGWPQPRGCWGGPEPPLSQQLWCLARGWGCGGCAQSPAAACGGHCPGLLGRAGLGRGQGAGERWAGSGLDLAVLGRGQQQHQGAVGACMGGLPAGLGAAEPGLHDWSPELQGQGRGGCSGPLLAWAKQEGGPGHSSLTADYQDLQGGHGASRVRPCTVARSTACPLPAMLCSLTAAEGTPSQPLHGALPPTSPQPSPVPSLLLFDAVQDLPVHASQHIC